LDNGNTAFAPVARHLPDFRLAGLAHANPRIAPSLRGGPLRLPLLVVALSAAVAAALARALT
jgi:hypothetical protein